MQIEICVSFHGRGCARPYAFVRNVKSNFTIAWRADWDRTSKLLQSQSAVAFIETANWYQNWNRFASMLEWKCRRLQIRQTRSYKKSFVKCCYIYFHRDLCLFKYYIYIYIYIAFFNCNFDKYTNFHSF